MVRIDIAVKRGNQLEREEKAGADEQSDHRTEERHDRGFAEDHSCDLQVGEPVDAQDGDLANAREDRHDHGVGDAQPAEQQTASADCPGRGLEDLELRIGAGELGIFKSDQVGILRLTIFLKAHGVVFVAQLDGDDGGSAFLVKEALRRAERHEDAAVLKAVGGFQNADDVESPMTDGHMAVRDWRRETPRRASPRTTSSFMLSRKCRRSPWSHLAFRMRASVAVTPKQVMMG